MHHEMHPLLGTHDTVAKYQCKASSFYVHSNSNTSRFITVGKDTSKIYPRA